MNPRSERVAQIAIDSVTAITALCAVLITALALHDRVAPRQSSGVNALEVQDRPVHDWRRLIAGAHRIGPSKAPLTILEFGDFECPACGAFEKALMAFRSAHPGAVTLNFREWPLPYHRLAYPLAEAAECAASQDRFPEFHDFVFAHQDSLAVLSPRAIAARVGIGNLPAYERCLNDSTVNVAIQSDIAAAQALGSRGTPTVIVNGVLMSRVPDVAQLETLLRNAVRR